MVHLDCSKKGLCCKHVYCIPEIIFWRWEVASPPPPAPTSRPHEGGDLAPLFSLPSEEAHLLPFAPPPPLFKFHILIFWLRAYKYIPCKRIPNRFQHPSHHGNLQPQI